MSGIESAESQEITSQIFGHPFPRVVGQSVEFWTLTDTARRRIEAKDLASRLSVNERLILQELHTHGDKETDELADKLNLRHQTILILLGRLKGYGYVDMLTSPAARV